MDGKQRLTASALARAEIAREKARISGKRLQGVSRLEQSAEEWEGEREKDKRRIEDRGAEIAMISLSQVPLEAMARGRKEDTEVTWKAAEWPGAGEKKGIRLNGAAITALAMKLKAVEWARAMGKRGTRQDSPAYRLEQNVGLWKQGRKPY